MSWDEFSACAGRDVDTVVDLGEDAVRQIATLWRSLPPDLKASILTAARWAPRYLTAALEAVGIVVSGELLLDAAAGIGLAALLALLVDCVDKI